MAINSSNAGGDRSVAERFEIDVGAALVILQIAVRRIIEQNRRTANEPIVEGPLQVNLRALQIGSNVASMLRALFIPWRVMMPVLE
jgi:hypothetical protein